MSDNSTPTAAVSRDTTDKPDGSAQPVSIADRQTFERTHFPEMGYEVIDSTTYRWSLKEFSWNRLEKRRQKLYGPTFECGGNTWKIMLFVGGVLANDPGKVSIYLVCDTTSKTHHPCAQLALAMSNHKDPTLFLTYNSYHRFTPHDDDWGFTYFCTTERLRSNNNNRGSILQDDTLEVSVFMRVVKDPTGVLWYNLGAGYCPRATTGHIGLVQQASSECLGIALQLLYMIAPFRKALNEIATEGHKPEHSLAYALQRLFYELQSSKDDSASIDEVCRCLSWADVHPRNARRDVIECFRMIQDRLLAQAPDGDSLAKPFSGRLQSFIRCLNVDFEMTSTQVFQGIDLDVHGLRTLGDSLREYINPRPLLGDLQFNVPGMGPQDSGLGLRLLDLPPVLMFNLRRWRYDTAAKSTFKCEDRFEFPTDLDMTDLVFPKRDGEEKLTYKLHGVVVHEGELEGRQYHAVFRPLSDGLWCKFEDSSVIPVKEAEARENCFEGSASACALVYVQESMIQDILQPAREVEFPSHIRKKSAAATDESMMTVKLVTKDIFKRHQGHDLAVDDAMEVLHMSKDASLLELRTQIAKTHKGTFHLRPLIKRHNRSIRPAKAQLPQTGAAASMTLQEIGKTYRNVIEECLTFYVDDTRTPDDKLQLFIKYFDFKAQTLLGAGTVTVDPEERVSCLRARISHLMRWPDGVTMNICEEVMHELLEDLDMDARFGQSNLQTGDILLVDRPVIPSARPSKKTKTVFRDARAFYASLPKP